MSHKNDPDYHDTRAKILLEAARRLNKLAEEKFGLSRAFWRPLMN